MRARAFPTVRDLSALIKAIKRSGIPDHYRADKEDTFPGILLTVVWDPSLGWHHERGPRAFAYDPIVWDHVAVVTVRRRSNARALARDIRTQLSPLT